MIRSWLIFVTFSAILWMVACSGSKSNLKVIHKNEINSNAQLTPLPKDTNIIVNKLENGIQYYIRENREPQNRAELRLVVNAGSVLEDDDQQGLAHFVEHMCFNGTEHFEKQALVDYLESIGMRFGPDVNAYTSFDETVYMLQIPTDSAEIVDTAFQILEEWAHRVSFEASEIDKERGVVVEEWRLGRGAQSRIRDKQFPVLFKNSRYANRLPIGQKAVIDTAHYETVRRFYKDWYRPDLMAVVAVGDFDRNAIKALIEKHFAAIPPKENPRKREYYPVPGNEKPLVAIVTDPEATYSSVSVYYKKDVKDENSHKAYRQSLVQSIHDGILNNRLNELLQQPEPPFRFASVGQGRFIRTKEFYVLNTVVKDNQMETGLEALLTEASRIKQFGVTASELERQKTDMLRGIEQAYQERDKTASASYAAEYIRNFLQDEPIPGIEYEFELWKKFIPSITLDEVNERSQQLITEADEVILASAPEKEGVKTANAEALLAVFDKVDEKLIAPYQDVVSDAPLLESLPAAGKVVKMSGIQEIGVSEWTLSNGVRLLLKPTDFKNDQVLFSAYSPGGTSLYPDEDYIAGATADAIVAQSGVGSFDRIELRKKLAGKAVQVSPSIGSLNEGISGSASPKDLETMLQLIHLYFTAPRKDSTAFQAYQSQIRGFLENRNASPETAFRDTLNFTLAQHHFRARPWSAQLLKEMNLDKSLKIYKERFADASDFTFVFVGNLDLNALKPLVEKYLASLPALHRNETWRDEGIRPPKGVIEKTVRKGLEEKSRVSIVFTGPFEWNRQNRYDLNAMVSVLQIKLREVLREDQGGTYGVGVHSSRNHFPVPDYSVSVSFGCAPDRVDQLTRLVFEQIDSLKNVGIAETYVQKVRETQRRENEVDMRRNGYWLSTLSFYDRNTEPLNNILQTIQFIENLTPKAVQQAARKYLNTNNYVKVILLPEKTGS